jgi:hypothetical protein
VRLALRVRAAAVPAPAALQLLVAYYHDLDLFINEPAPTTTAFVLRISAATRAVVEEESFAGDALLYIEVPFAALSTFAGGMGADTRGWAHAPDRTTDGWCALPDGQLLALDPTAFPLAEALNHQPSYD